MKIIQTMLGLLCPAAFGSWLAPRFGGDSTSRQTSETNDQRVVGGEGSINLSQKISGSNNVVSTTDHGAVSGALALAMKGVEAAHDTTQQTIEASGGLLSGALKMAGEQQQAFTDTVKAIKTSDVRVLVIAGLAVVGLGAAIAFKKG